MTELHELAPDVFLLSTVEPVSNRSWLPEGASGFEPFNRYFVRSKDHAILIDTGPAAHRNSLLTLLGRLVGSRRFTVMVTRSELDCISNVGSVVDQYPDVRVIGTMKNLNLLGLVHMKNPVPAGLAADRMPIGGDLGDYGFARLHPAEPIIKTLSTVWMIDRDTGFLFTSDFFSDDLMQTKDESVVRSDIGRSLDPVRIRRHVLTKFDWLAHADTESIQSRWERFFADVHPTAILPALGRIQMGAEPCSSVISAYRSAIFDPPRQ